MTTDEEKLETRNLKLPPASDFGAASEANSEVVTLPAAGPAAPHSYHLDHLGHLESEAIHVMREVAAEFERPCLLFSGGKDSICLLRLAEKAFRPSDIPMPLLNVDTGHHFPELNEFRDRRAKQLGARLIVRTVEDAIAKGIAVPATA